MRIIKKIYNFIFFIIKTTLDGAIYVADFTAKGFYYYFYVLFKFLHKTFHFKFLDKIAGHFQLMQERSESFLLLLIYVFSFCALYNITYKESDRVVKIDDSVKTNITETSPSKEQTPKEDVSDDKKYDGYVSLFKKYGKYTLDEVNIGELKGVNDQTVGWLTVDSTSINYPIVQTSDNDFYLSHSFDKSFKLTGWTFMDYRNNSDLSDDNTIFYGHNLINDTSFGSVGEIFKSGWVDNSNHIIVVVDGNNNRHYYEIFSYYYSDPNSDYLVTNFFTDNEKRNFLNSIKSKSLYNFNIELSEEDKIITLSTCTDDNSGREVVHAVLRN